MIGEANKAIVAAIMAILVLIDQLWGIGFGAITEEWITVLLTILTPVFVWLTPNRKEHPKAR